MGFTERECTGDWVWASSFSNLYDYHYGYDFKSYLYVSDPDVCYVFEEAETVTGTPEPSTGTDGGGPGGGGDSSGRAGNSAPRGGVAQIRWKCLMTSEAMNSKIVGSKN